MSTLASNPFILKVHQNRGMIFPMAFIGLLVVILVPLPTWVLDLLLVSNITLSVTRTSCSPIRAEATPTAIVSEP